MINKYIYFVVTLFILLFSSHKESALSNGLMFTDERLSYLKGQYSVDATLKRYVDNSISNADLLLTYSIPSYSSDMLSVSCYTRDLITGLAFAYRWTNDTKYADRVKQILLSVCNFSDWNPSHFLDPSVMGIAVSIGLDWTEDYLDENTKELARQALINKYLTPGINGMNSNAYWTWADNNWNIQCNGGLIIAALAIEDYDDYYIDFILPKAIENLDAPLNNYNPDGAWFEGPMYSVGSLNNYSFIVSSLLSMHNDDYGLLDYPGMKYAGDFYSSCTGKNDVLFCFSDIFQRSKRALSPGLFFLGGAFSNDALVANEHDFLARASDNDVFHIVWYKQKNSSVTTATKNFFDGDFQFVFFDKSPTDNNAIYFAHKAGINGTSHGHLDIGSFEMDALGVRWARDLGLENYNLPGQMDFETDDGQRYTYYRLNSFSHNVPIINNANQLVDASATFTNVSMSADAPFSIIDLTSPYRNYAESLMRGIKMIDNNRSIIIQDEYSLKSSYESYWGMTTDAFIQIVNSTSAILTQNGQQMYATILSPSNVYFEIQEAIQDEGGYSVDGVSRLIARKPSDGIVDFTMCIQLSPVWNGYHTALSDLIPLDQWGTDPPQPDNEPPTIPTNLTGVPVSSNRVDLSWEASSDNVGVMGYIIYRNGIEISRTAGLQFSDINLVSGTAYNYSVKAYDLAGNVSNESNHVVITTLIGADTEPPSQPQDLVAYEIFSTEIKLSWTSSTDNVGVIGYNIYRDGIHISTSDNLDHADNGLSPGTEYIYSVTAFDQAGNESVHSPEARLTTQSDDKIIYIDPESDNINPANGSIDAPYTSWSQVEWIRGYSYLQLRNTVCYESKILITADSVFIGGYGNGERPKIISTAEDFAMSIYNKSNITISDLEIESSPAVASVYFAGDDCNNNLIERCKIKGGVYCIRIIGGDNYTIQYNDLESSSNTIYTMAGNTKIYYNALTNADTAVQINDYSSQVEVFNNVFVNNLQAISSSYGGLTLYNNIFSLDRPGSKAISQELDSITSDYNIFYPTQAGFIRIAGKTFDDLQEYTEEQSVDVNSKDADPYFINRVGGDYRVQDNSPAIESGIDVNMSVDKYGTAVPSGLYPDIGIFEKSQGIISFLHSLPVTNDLTIFPNPNVGKFRIKMSGNAFIGNVEIYDEKGNKVYSAKSTVSNSNEFGLSWLKSGNYILRLNNGSRQYSEKFTIIN